MQTQTSYCLCHSYPIFVENDLPTVQRGGRVNKFAMIIHLRQSDSYKHMQIILTLQFLLPLTFIYLYDFICFSKEEIKSINIDGTLGNQDGGIG